MEVCIRSRAWTYERLTKVASKDSKSKRSSAVERWEPLADNSIVVNQGDLVLIVFRTADNGLGEGQGLAIAGYEQQVYLTGVTSNESKKLILRADKAGTFKIYNPVHSAPGNVLAQMTGTLIVKPATTKK